MDADFAGGWNQEGVKDPGSVLSRTYYVISYSKFPIIWDSRLQTEIALSTTEAGYIALSAAMRGFLPFVSLMKEIEFVLEIQGDTPKVLCSPFENPVTVYEDNRWAIALAVSPQIRPLTKHIAIKYHHFRSFIANGDIEIQHFYIK